MKRVGNRGYSLIELLVAFALLAIVSSILLGFVSSGGRLYNSVSSEVSLQIETQVALAQLKEYIIDCNEGLCFEVDPAGVVALYIVNSTSDGGEYTMHTFRFEQSEKRLYYGSSAVLPNESGTPTYSSAADDLMADDMTGFLISFQSATGGEAASVGLKAEFAVRNKSYEVSQTLSLRNKPLFSGSSLDELMTLIFLPD